MKILFVNSFYYPRTIGGAELCVQMLAEEMVQRGHQVTVIANSTGTKREQSDVNGVKVVCLPQKNIYIWPPAARNPLKRALWHLIDRYHPLQGGELANCVDEEQPDLIHTHNLAGISTSVWGWAKAKRLPLVHTTHDYYLLCPKSTMNRDGVNCVGQCATCRLFTSAQKNESAAISAAVCVSQHVLKMHLDSGYFRDTPIREVFYNPCMSQSDKPKTRPNDPILRLGFIGRIEPEKGVELILKAASKLSPERFQISIAGRDTGDYAQSLKKKYIYPHVHWLGFQKQDDFYEKVDVVLVPSVWHEPMSLVLLEAFGHGVPVLGSRRGGIPEMVDEGRTGFLFEPDVDGLADAVSKLDLEQCRSMEGACRAKAALLTREEYIRKHIDLYNRVRGT